MAYLEEVIEEYALEQNFPFILGFTVLCAYEVMDKGWSWQALNFNNDGVTVLGLNIETGEFDGQNLLIVNDEIADISFNKKLFSIDLTITTTEDAKFQVESGVDEDGQIIYEEIVSPQIMYSVRKKVPFVNWHKDNIKRIFDSQK